MYGTDDPESAKSLFLGLVSGIKYPVSAVIAAHPNAQGVSASAVSDQKTLTGKGAEGSFRSYSSCREFFLAEILQSECPVRFCSSIYSFLFHQ